MRSSLSSPISAWVRHLGVALGLTSAGPLVLGLLGCPASEPPGTPGIEDRLLFTFTGYGATAGVVLAADGATARVALMPADASFTFRSSDPAILDIAPDGTLVTGEPGEVEVIAADATGDVDRVRLRVARAATVAITDVPALMALGYESAVRMGRLDAGGVTLSGEGGWEVVGTGGLAARLATDEDMSSGRWRAGAILDATELGAGAFTVRTGPVEHTVTTSVVGPEAIDAITELHRMRSGGGPDSVAVRLRVQASSEGEPVAGARCAWSAPGATVGLESLERDGTLLTDFWTDRPSFVARCEIGSVTQDFEVTIADLQ